jgi:hypothetical protein
MEDENLPLRRRIPGAARAGPVDTGRPVLPESVLLRMQAAVDAAKEASKPGQEPAATPTPSRSGKGSAGDANGVSSLPDHGARQRRKIKRDRAAKAHANGQARAGESVRTPPAPPARPTRPEPGEPPELTVPQASEPKPERKPEPPPLPRRMAQPDRPIPGRSDARRERPVPVDGTGPPDRTAPPDGTALPNRGTPPNRAALRGPEPLTLPHRGAPAGTTAPVEHTAPRGPESLASPERTVPRRADPQPESGSAAPPASAAVATPDRTAPPRSGPPAPPGRAVPPGSGTPTLPDRISPRGPEPQPAPRELSDQTDANAETQPITRPASPTRHVSAGPRAATGSAAAPTAEPAADDRPGPAADGLASPTSRVGSASRAPARAANAPPRTPRAAPAPPHARPQRTKSRPKLRRRSRTAPLVALALVAIAAVAIVAALSGHTSPPSASGPLSRQEVANDNQAAEWVVQQVSQSAVVACDEQMCAALKAHGFPAANVRVLGPTLTSPLSSSVVIATATVRALFGTSLASAYAPVVLTTVGSGPGAIEIRAVARRGPAAYQRALASDLASQRKFGVTLLTSPQITASPHARSEMKAGQVDGRVLLAILDLAGVQPVDIIDFGNETTLESPGVPLRDVDLAVGDKASRLTGQAYVDALIKALGTLSYRPAQATTVTLPTGVTVLRIVFSAPSPFGVLPSS